MKQPTISRIILSLMSLCFFCNVLFAQNMVKVTGTVTDKQNSPMIGASVFEKGTRNGAITDIDGKYSISVPEGGFGDMKGAFHSSELWYVFGTLGRCWRPMEQHDYDLSAKMVEYWTNFAKNGNPDGEGLPQWKPCAKGNEFIMELK